MRYFLGFELKAAHSIMQSFERNNGIVELIHDKSLAIQSIPIAVNCLKCYQGGKAGQEGSAFRKN
jgi:hypothetical protein